VAEVGQRYQRISTELGLAQESQVRELMRHFAGKQVDGSLFSLEGALTLPHFASVAPHQTLDMELDVVAETCTEPGRTNDERWAVEIKWRNEPAIRKELESFWHNARTIGGHPLRLGSSPGLAFDTSATLSTRIQPYGLAGSRASCSAVSLIFRPWPSSLASALEDDESLR